MTNCKCPVRVVLTGLDMVVHQLFDWLKCVFHLPKAYRCGAFQACTSADSSFVEAGQHLQALKELCDTLSPEDAHRLAHTQLRECQTRLADIQRQFSGDQDAPLADSR